MEMRHVPFIFMLDDMKPYKNSWGVEIYMTDCSEYIEDPFICDDVGQPKGQCICGHKWYEHNVNTLPMEDRISTIKAMHANQPTPTQSATPTALHSLACSLSDCRMSRGICDALTFGSGKLDPHGYWEIPCEACAREWESKHPEDGQCWPYAENIGNPR